MELLAQLGSNWSHVTQCLERNGMDPTLLDRMPQWDSDIAYRCHIICWMLSRIGPRHLGVDPDCLKNAESTTFEKQVEAISAVAIALKYCDDDTDAVYAMIGCGTPPDRSRLVTFVCHMALVLDNCRMARERGVSVQQHRVMDDAFLEAVLASHMTTLGPYPIGAKPLEPFSTQHVDEMCRVKSKLEQFVEERSEAVERMKMAAGVEGHQSMTTTTSSLLDALCGQYQCLVQFDNDLGGAVTNLHQLMDHVSHFILPLLNATNKTIPSRNPIVPTMERVCELSKLLHLATQALQDSCDVYISLQERKQRAGPQTIDAETTALKVQEVSAAVLKLNQLIAALPTAVRSN